MYDLLIRNGTVIDGSGHPGYRADVAIQGGRIAAIVDVSGTARHVIDADGHVVTPGFIDGPRPEEHTSELQSLMRNSYAVFGSKKNKTELIHILLIVHVMYRTEENKKE